jgi:hypothetical protein
VLIPLAALPAFVLSLIGVIRDSRKGWAIAGLVLSLLLGAIIAVPIILALVMKC